MVYSSGISTSSTQSTFTGLAFDQNFNVRPTVGTVDARGKQQSLLSQQYAPPKLNAEEEGKKVIRSAMRWLIASLVIAMLFQSNEAILTISMLVAIVSFIRLYTGFSDASSGRKEDAKNAMVYQNWQKSFLCFTCGNLFIP